MGLDAPDLKDFPSDFRLPKNAEAIVANERSYAGGTSAGDVLKAIRSDSNRSLKDVCQQLVNDSANYFKWDDYTIMSAFIKDFSFDESLKQADGEIRYQEF